MRLLLLAMLPALLHGQSLETVKVAAGSMTRNLRLPAELRPFMKTAIRARVSGFVERVNVDVGAKVQTGQVLAVLTAPELAAQTAAAEAKVVEIGAQRAAIEARLATSRSTLERLQNAARTEGAIAQNEIVVAEGEVRALEAAASSVDASVSAARAAVQPLRDLQAFLEIRAPFDGVITQRLTDPGALVGPSAADPALFDLEQVSKLRLVIAVPEGNAGGVSTGAAVRFRVPAFADREFTGMTARLPGVMDAKTRSLPVEADVENSNGALAPGMYAEVNWPARATRRPLLVPPTAVVVTTARTFLIRVRSGKAEWVDVVKGESAGDSVEVFGALAPGDEIVRRGSDEIREGTAIR